ncbi:MAG: hypothetical protein ACPLRW_02470 [Moorellales bacterium]
MKSRTKANEVLGWVLGGLFLVSAGIAAASGAIEFLSINLRNLFAGLMLAFVFFVFPVLLYVFLVERR